MKSILSYLSKPHVSVIEIRGAIDNLQ